MAEVKVLFLLFPTAVLSALLALKDTLRCTQISPNDSPQSCSWVTVTESAVSPRSLIRGSTLTVKLVYEAILGSGDAMPTWASYILKLAGFFGRGWMCWGEKNGNFSWKTITFLKVSGFFFNPCSCVSTQWLTILMRIFDIKRILIFFLWYAISGICFGVFFGQRRPCGLDPSGCLKASFWSTWLRHLQMELM